MGEIMNFCVNCGNKVLEKDQKFCIYCGAELKMENAQEDNQTSNDHFDNFSTENEVITFEEPDIEQIRTYTLSDKDADCKTYHDTLDFLSNKLPNEREGHFHYINRPIKINGKTLILFKYKGELIAKGIFSECVEREEISQGKKYPGYYQLEKCSVEIFNSSIDLNTINRYFPVKSLSRDQIFDKKYFDEIFKMIKDFTKYK